MYQRFPTLAQNESEYLARALKHDALAYDAIRDGIEPNWPAYQHNKAIAREAWRRYFETRTTFPTYVGLFGRRCVVFTTEQRRGEFITALIHQTTLEEPKRVM